MENVAWKEGEGNKTADCWSNQELSNWYAMETQHKSSHRTTWFWFNMLCQRWFCVYVFLPGRYFNACISSPSTSSSVWKLASLDPLPPSQRSFLFHHTLRHSQPDLSSQRSPPASLPLLSLPPSSHEFIMGRKIEPWLFVPVSVCHCSQMNNSDRMAEVRIEEKEEIILELFHSGYFWTASCQYLSCSGYSSFASCALPFLPQFHSLPRGEKQILLSCLFFRWMAYDEYRGSDL